MNIYTTRKISDLVISWCAEVLGKSKYHSDYPIPVVQYKSDVYNKRCYGEYDQYDNIIFVYTRVNRTVKILINTIIHEYVHYLQQPAWINRYIKKYGTKLKNNPYECKAETVALSLSKTCEKQLRSKINRWLRKTQHHTNHRFTGKKQGKVVV